MSTVNERAVRRMGSRRATRRLTALRKELKELRFDMPSLGLQVADDKPFVLFENGDELDSIVDRRKAESKTARPWWWFW